MVFPPVLCPALEKNIGLPAASQTGACDAQLSGLLWNFPRPSARKPAGGPAAVPEIQTGREAFLEVCLPPCLRVPAHFSDQLEARVELGLERSGDLGAVGVPHTQIQHKQRTYLHFCS